MSREILFKAKRTYNREWVEGYIVRMPTGKWEIARKCDNPIDCDPMWSKVLITYEVYPETICQFSGLTDKNGKKIFECHILKDRNGKLYVVMYDESLGTFIFKDEEILGLYRIHEMEIVGNVFDNPELLEQEG